MKLARLGGWLAAAAMLAPSPGAKAATQPAKPRPPFEATPAPPAPDYASETAWAALPWRLDAADAVPPGASPGLAPASAPVDVFYVYPTTDLRTDRWNAPVDDPVTNDWTDRSVIARQASVFNAAGRVFAPRYRQGSTASGDPTAADGGPAFALAFRDVRSAFHYYLAHWNRGRPFILAGHSQGSFMVLRLLEEISADPQLRARLVAAYAPGSGLTVGEAAARFASVPLCTRPDQTTCVAAWNTFLAGTDVESYAKLAARFAAQAYGAASGTELACINPLSFDSRRPAAPRSANLGALPQEPGKLPLPRLAAHAAGATCVNGVLVVDATAPSRLDVSPLPGGSMHFHDYALFYENVRLNALTRAEAWLAHERSGRAH